MILGGRHSGRGQARKEWAPVLRGQGEAAGSLGTRKHDSPDVAPADDLGTPQPPGLQKKKIGFDAVWKEVPGDLYRN